MAKIPRKELDECSLQEKETKTNQLILSLLHSRRRSGEAGKLNEQLEATKVVPLLPFLVFFFFSQ